MELTEILVPIVFFGLVFGIVYIAIAARNKERMALIERGADATIFNKGKTPGTGLWILRSGIFAIGIAFGIIVGSLMASAGVLAGVAYTSAIFFFGGTALVAAFFIGRKVNGKNK